MAANSGASLPVRFYLLIIALGRLFAPLFLLTIRLTWGYQFYLTGKGKLSNLDKVASFFATLNIPMPKFNAALAGATECFGGALLAVGLMSRLVSIPLTFTMLVAYWTAERPDIHSLDEFVHAAPFPFLFTALVIFAFGPGLLSLDGFLKHTLFRKESVPR